MVIKKEVKSVKTTQKYPIKYEGMVKINDKRKINDFVCGKCLKPIIKNQRFVVLGTYVLNKKDKQFLNVGFVQEDFYHLPCWTEYFNQKVIERLTQSQSQAMDFLKSNPMFDNLIKNARLLTI